MSNIRVGESERDRYGYYLYDEPDTIPGPDIFSAEDYAQFNAVRAAWEAWQERLEAAHKVQRLQDEKFRSDEKERAEFERLKKKFG